MEISEIKIKNVKGFGDPAYTIHLDNTIKSNRVNLLVAPNGFGKSSLTAAFESLKRDKLEVIKENKYKQDETLESELSIKIDGTSYKANKSINELKDKLSATVIHCDTYPVAVTKNMGKFSTTKGYIGIKSVEICRVPTYKKLEYKITLEKKNFGVNGKLLKNHEDEFASSGFISLLTDEVIENIKKLDLQKPKASFKTIRDYLNLKKGTEDKIRNTIDDEIFSDLNENQNYTLLKKTFCENLSELDSFTKIYQIHSLINNNPKKNITNIRKYFEYISFKNKLNANIKNVDTTWKNIECSEHDECLWVEFPNADIISNGQRDILTFTVHLQIFKSKLQIGRNNLLIIDEVFDYLDDANVLAVQYYLTDLLHFAKENNVELTLCLLTHLDPKYFRTYTFSKKVLNVCYLKDVQAKASDSMKYFIAFRQSLNHQVDGPEKELWTKLSKYCFHYHKDSPNFKVDVIPYKNGKWNKFREDWCESTNLCAYLISELNKYLSDSPTYDPYAVSLAIRIGTEKKVYEQFISDEDKISFMDEHDKGTKDKIEFAETKDIMIPDAYYILALIHGESDHIEYDENQMKFNERPVIYKLNNTVIKHMVAKLFDFEPEIPVPLSKLH